MLTSLATMRTYRSPLLLVVSVAAVACGGSDPQHMTGRSDAAADAATADATDTQPDQLPREAGGNDAPDAEAGASQEAGSEDVNPGEVDLGQGDVPGGEGDMAGPDMAAADMATGDMAEVGVDARCATCSADQICVARYDGACEILQVSCEDKEAGCQVAVCSEACNRRLCGFGTDASPGFSCATTHCPGKVPVAGAFGCYGP